MCEKEHPEEQEDRKNEHQEGHEDREIDRFQSIVDRANKEITGVRHVYIWLASILGLIIIAGITAISLTTWNTIGDMRSDLREETKLITSRLEDEVDLVGRQVTSRIEEEFDKDNIHDLVQTAANERIDAVADQIISKNIIEEVNPLASQLRDLNDRIVVMDKKLEQIIEDSKQRLGALEKETHKELVALKEESQLVATIVRAENNDRRAFEQIRKWHNDESFQFSAEATAAYQKIRSMHNSPIYRSGFTVPWKNGIEPSKLNLSDLKKNYQNISVSTPHLKPALIEYIWKREDIPKRNRMEFLIEVLKTDDSLVAVEYAGRYFAEGASLSKDPLAVDEFVSWWEANKDKIK